MRVRSRGIGLLITGAALAVTITACGSSSAAAPAASSSASSSASSVLGSAAPYFKDLPASIQKAGVLNVGTSVAFPPYDFNPAGSNTVIGFEPDLDKAMAKLLGVKLNLDVVGFPELIPGVQDKRFEVAVDGIVMLVPTAKAAGVTSLLNICGHTLAYATGTFGQQTANIITKLCVKAHKPATTESAFPDAPSIQLALESGRISYEIEDPAPGGYDAKASKGR